MTDEHCGKKWYKRIATVKLYEIGLNNYICKKMKLYKPNIFIKILWEDHWGIARMTDKHYGKNDINELYIWNYKTGLNNYLCEKNENCTKKISSTKIQRKKT